jgi:hypothetical protein
VAPLEDAEVADRYLGQHGTGGAPLQKRAPPRLGAVSAEEDRARDRHAYDECANAPSPQEIFDRYAAHDPTLFSNPVCYTGLRPGEIIAPAGEQAVKDPSAEDWIWREE